MTANNFKVFNESKTNIMNDTDYGNHIQRKKGVVSGVANSTLHNKLYRQTSIVAKAVADFIASQGLDATDNDSVLLSTNLLKALEKVTKVPLEGHRTKGVLDHPDGSVTTSKIADRNITTEKIAYNSVGTTELKSEVLYPYVTKTGTGASGTWGINIAGNANTATNADKLDGFHETSFLRYRGCAQTNGEDTLWGQIGVKAYGDRLPEGVNGTYPYGAVVSLPADDGPRLDIWYNHMSSVNGDGLWYRSGFSENKKPWAVLLDTVNYNKYTPTKTGTGASGTWGIDISGTATKAEQDSLGNTIKDTYATKKDIQVITGEVANGGTIPLPNGFLESECKWFAGIKHSNVNEWRIDIEEGYRSNLLAPICTLDGRVVTVGTQVAGLDGGSYTQDGPVNFAGYWSRAFMPGTAWYMCIGIHR